MFSKRDPGDWSLTPELQKKYDEVVAHTRRLQAELGITPMTLDERLAAYEKRKAEEARKAKELAELQQRIGQHKPLPKWRI